jgi:20S proteasome subunit beta 6
MNASLRRSRFDPYQDNGGSILAIAGADFTVIAGDTRQSLDYNIQTRYARKVWQLCVARACSG